MTAEPAQPARLSDDDMAEARRRCSGDGVLLALFSEVERLTAELNEVDSDERTSRMQAERRIRDLESQLAAAREQLLTTEVHTLCQKCNEPMALDVPGAISELLKMKSEQMQDAARRFSMREHGEMWHKIADQRSAEIIRARALIADLIESIDDIDPRLRYVVAHIDRADLERAREAIK
jgi:hypothetical protein